MRLCSASNGSVLDANLPHSPGSDLDEVRQRVVLELMIPAVHHYLGRRAIGSNTEAVGVIETEEALDSVIGEGQYRCARGGCLEEPHAIHAELLAAVQRRLCHPAAELADEAGAPLRLHPRPGDVRRVQCK